MWPTATCRKHGLSAATLDDPSWTKTDHDAVANAVVDLPRCTLAASNNAFLLAPLCLRVAATHVVRKIAWVGLGMGTSMILLVLQLEPS